MSSTTFLIFWELPGAESSCPTHCSYFQVEKPKNESTLQARKLSWNLCNPAGNTTACSPPVQITLLSIVLCVSEHHTCMNKRGESTVTTALKYQWRTKVDRLKMNRINLSSSTFTSNGSFQEQASITESWNSSYKAMMKKFEWPANLFPHTFTDFRSNTVWGNYYFRGKLQIQATNPSDFLWLHQCDELSVLGINT